MKQFLFSCSRSTFVGLVLALGVAAGLIGCSGKSGQPAPIPVLSFVLAGGVTLDMVEIPAGVFLMGSGNDELDRSTDEGPQHRVTIGQVFHIGKFEVTQGQWQAVMGNNPSFFTGNPSLPVESVSWNQITQSGTGFLDKLNVMTAASRPGGKVFRLPTEAEWEYAARAGSATRFYWGDDLGASAIGNYAWHAGNSDSGSRRSSHPVGLKLSNAWGLYDMAGNVIEWCQDSYGRFEAAPQTGPAGPAAGAYKVLKGGGWDYDSYAGRSAYRDAIAPDSRVNILGLRVVLAPVLAQ
jgi:formylglycine-generating enzyme required for sulfatase activity